LFELQVSFVKGSGSGVYLAVLRDICERKKNEEQLKYLAATDSLTGIFNRRRVLELAASEIDRAQKAGTPISVILLDVDNLKPINDTAGHRAGDRVLEEVAARCQANLRSGDIFGRYGGDEFIAVLPETPSQMALLVAERLREHIEDFSIPGRAGHFNVTISIGVTVVQPNGHINLDMLLEQADRALYRAKEAGRNRVMKY
jgi:diguanylate cyclase (GGDEF)-like protein